ncbi:MAG: zinc ribbon domain-containing protein [Acidobacteriota bacterium]
MFCPKCAAQNLDGASFCRVCGANISLVSQALTGQIPQTMEDYRDRMGRRARRWDRKREPSLDSVCKNIFMGIAFLCVSITLGFTRMGYGWWFWMLIPAFSMLGSGVAQYLRLRESKKQSYLPNALGQPVITAPRRVDSFPAPSTGELVRPPPSVTEGTTRHLGAEAPTRHLDD